MATIHKNMCVLHLILLLIILNHERALDYNIGAAQRIHRRALSSGGGGREQNLKISESFYSFNGYADVHVCVRVYAYIKSHL